MEDPMEEAIVNPQSERNEDIWFCKLIMQEVGSLRAWGAERKDGGPSTWELFSMISVATNSTV